MLEPDDRDDGLQSRWVKPIPKRKADADETKVVGGRESRPVLSVVPEVDPPDTLH